MRYCLILILLIGLTHKSYSQSLLQKKVNIDADKFVLHDIFTLLTAQTGALFSYNPQEVNSSQIISYKADNLPLLKVLEDLLHPSVLIKERGRYVILTKEGAADVLDNIAEHAQRKEVLSEIRKISLYDSGNLPQVCHSSTKFKNDEQMKKEIAALMLVLATATVNVDKLAAQEQTQPKAKSEKQAGPLAEKPFQVSFISPLGTDGMNSPKNTYKFSLNLLGGVTGGLNGLEFGGLYNINKYKTYGAQFAGIFNYTDTLRGFQWAGIGNIAKNGKSVFQVAGIFNFKNHSEGNTSTQIAGIGNLSLSGKTAVQVSPIVNIADTTNCQVSTIVNVARKSKFQIGLVNVSDSANIMIGLVNIARNGFMEVEAAGGEFMHASVSFRSGTKKLYGILSFGYNFSDEFFGYGAGIGTTLDFNDKWGMNIEAVQYSLADKNFKQKKYNGLSQIRPVVHYNFNKKISIFGGPVANVYVGDKSDENKLLHVSAPYTIWDYDGSKKKVEAWFGFTAGVRIKL